MHYQYSWICQNWVRNLYPWERHKHWQQALNHQHSSKCPKPPNPSRPQTDPIGYVTLKTHAGVQREQSPPTWLLPWISRIVEPQPGPCASLRPRNLSILEELISERVAVVVVRDEASETLLSINCERLLPRQRKGKQKPSESNCWLGRSFTKIKHFFNYKDIFKKYP